ncbi:MAG: hypothetical protein Q7J01_04250 [Syntrophales bacterium]|nr:hypothetical protein [Syntrophales bacterium]
MSGHRLIRGQGGSVLMVLIITMVILAGLSAAILPTLFTTEMGQVSASGAMKAYYLAEAGGRYTLPRLQNISVGTHIFKFSDGSKFFEIEKLPGTQFTSTGVVSEGTNLESRVTITYTTSGSLFDYELPDGAADWPDKTSELNTSNNETVNIDAGNYSASSIDMANNSTLNITGDVVIYVNGTTSASNNGRINIASGGSLTIYAAGDMSFANNFIGNPSQPPASFIIYGIAGCNNIYLGNNSNVSAVFYAPTTDITVGNNGIVSGAMVGETITLGNNAEVHYDEDLQNLYSGGGGNTVEQYFTEN